MRVELHPEARAEIRSAALWYDQRRIGLGDEFIAEIAITPDRISEAAESFPKWPGSPATVPPIRRATLRRFPYVIAFESNRREILVLAVAYGKRRPLYLLALARRHLREDSGEVRDQLRSAACTRAKLSDAFIP